MGFFSMSFFRPCIDLHDGKVKQIIGSTLRDDQTPITNFQTDRSPAWFADLYKRDHLTGGHVIALGPGNDKVAREALSAWPGGLQIGGGITNENAMEWIEAGASHVIVTSYVFREGRIDWDRLKELTAIVSRKRLVLDLSCRRKNGDYYIVTDRWQRYTNEIICSDTLLRLAHYADEFLIHAADVEGLQAGVDSKLIAFLTQESPIPTTYAGGVRCLEDMRALYRVSRGRLSVTVGSALDIFGGSLPYKEVVSLCQSLEKS